MNLIIYQPTDIFLDAVAKKIVGEAPSGSFGILPKHIDFVTALVPGIMAYETDAGKEEFLALNGGLLVKQGDRVFIATQKAVRGELGDLRETVNRIINEVDEKERQTRTAVARLEANFIRRFMEFGKNA